MIALPIRKSRNKLALCSLFLISIGSLLPISHASAALLVNIASEDDSVGAMVAGDVDGDLDLDLVVATSNSPNRLYINQGGAQSGTEGSYDSGSDIDSDGMDTTSLALGDVDGDGDLDLITGNASDYNRVYLNDGEGGFGDGLDASLDTHSTNAVALVAVDGPSSDLSLIAVNAGQPSRVYFNDGNGVYLRSNSSNISFDINDSSSIASGDVDGDGDVDLVIGNEGQANRLYLNDGSGGFGSGSDVGSDSGVTKSVVLSDLDHDGDLDLVVANEGDVNHLYLNNGSGVFGSASDLGVVSDTHAMSIADVDWDGDLDLVFANVDGLDLVHVNLGGIQGGTEGSFDADGEALVIDMGNVTALDIADMDNNGTLDLVAETQTGTIKQLKTSGKGVFGNGFAVDDSSYVDITADEDDSLSSAIADLDGDGDLDYVVGNHIAPNKVYVRQPDGSFVSSDLGTVTDVTTSIAIGKVNNDDLPDIVTGNQNAPNRVYLNLGGGVFDSGNPVSSDTNTTSSIALGDIDQDGDDDLVEGNSDPDQTNLLYINQNGVFDAAVEISEDKLRTQAVVLGDVNGDDYIDIVTANSRQSNPNRIYLNNAGTGEFTGRQAQDDGADLTSDDDYTYVAALADVDNDNDLDFIAANSGITRLYFNDEGFFSNGNGALLGVPLNTEKAHTATSIATGDVDNDGDTDFVIGTRHLNQLFLNQGGIQGGIIGTFDQGSDINADVLGTRSIALEDIDGDDHPDVVTANWNSPNRVYLNLVDQLELRVGPSVRDLVVSESLDPVSLTIGCFGSASATASIDYRIEAGTATEDDVEHSSGTLTWDAGQCATKTISLNVFSDDLAEGEEAFYLVLENPQGLYNNDPISQVRRYAVTINSSSQANDSEEESAGGSGGGAAVWLLGLLMLGGYWRARTAALKRI